MLSGATPTVTGVTLGPETRVCISYRRADTAASASYLYGSLTTRFWRRARLSRHRHRRPGQDSGAVIDRAINSASVLNSPIGGPWSRSKPDRHLLEDPAELVRLELRCYRILGSLQDAEDMLQETLLAAWRGLDGGRRRNRSPQQAR